MSKNISKHTNGFTLIELLLYIAIFTILMLTVVFFLQSTLAGKVKNQLIDSTNQEAEQAMLLITQSIRNATSITAPALGTSAASATIVVPTVANSPTVFDLSGGQLRIKEGTATAVPLTSTRVTVSGISFTNLGMTGTDGSLRVIFTVTATTTSSLQEFTYSHTYEESASIRN